MQMIVTGGYTMHVDVRSLQNRRPAVFRAVTGGPGAALAAAVPATLDKLAPRFNRHRRSLLRAYSAQQIDMYTYRVRLKGRDTCGVPRDTFRIHLIHSKSNASKDSTPSAAGRLHKS